MTIKKQGVLPVIFPILLLLVLDNNMTRSPSSSGGGYFLALVRLFEVLLDVNFFFFCLLVME